ncbi:FAD linked oxidase domain protein [Ktedonobacter racemifer DSM 44963]|uniref:FAD linked oxidase domain protein n=2 Tax=Ktedonobacter racemifer TaxID=363277 RepID=D6TWR7_KTERA|nr:FAD linked oxidase domain protein [Ktedonobacter racemifer DSM 44963]
MKQEELTARGCLRTFEYEKGSSTLSCRLVLCITLFHILPCPETKKGFAKMSHDGSHVDTQPPAHADLPIFEGIFSTEEGDRRLASDDFGHLVHRVPSAVLSPRSVDDVVRVVQYARQHGLTVAPRGQGHSTSGQAQVEGGIVVHLTSLNAITAIHADCVEVEAGALWSTLLQATLAQGLTPPVLTDFTGLSIGGVLSVGGIGGTSYRYGPIVDNVLALEVVTGEGKLETCSPQQQPDLFHNVLAGLGQCGMIVKATLRLVPAPTHARVFHLFYPHVGAMLHDQRLLMRDGRFDYLLGYIIPTPQGTWGYMLEGTIFYTSSAQHPDNAQLLAHLGFIAGIEQVEDMTYLTFANRVVLQVDGLKAQGAWDQQHPWFDVFVPDSKIEPFVSEALAEISPIDFGLMPILLYGLDSASFRAPLLPAPAEGTFFLFDILRSLAPSSGTLAQAIEHNRQLYERSRALGATCYPIGTLNLTPADWQAHFGPQWVGLQRAKQRFDPDDILTPGQNIFPRQK